MGGGEGGAFALLDTYLQFVICDYTVKKRGSLIDDLRCCQMSVMRIAPLIRCFACSCYAFGTLQEIELTLLVCSCIFKKKKFSLVL